MPVAVMLQRRLTVGMQQFCGLPFMVPVRVKEYDDDLLLVRPEEFGDLGPHVP